MRFWLGCHQVRRLGGTSGDSASWRTRGEEEAASRQKSLKIALKKSIQTEEESHLFLLNPSLEIVRQFFWGGRWNKETASY